MHARLSKLAQTLQKKSNIVNKCIVNKCIVKQSAFCFSNFQMQEHHQTREYLHLKPTEFKIQPFHNPTELGTRKILKDILIESQQISVQKLSQKLDIEVQDLQQTLQALAIPSDLETLISLEESEIAACVYNCKVVTKAEKKEDLPGRPPVITIMGHVDHGKTTLLDALYNSEIAANEYGAITQKIGAFHVINHEKKRFTVIDTPGHEAFINMRYRGAQSTDIVVLVVSATDGVQQQTLEVINIVKETNVPMILAINKIDVLGADPAEVEKEIVERTGLALETNGGNIPVIHISAKYKKNIDLLEELVLFEAEYLNLREKIDCAAEGMVLESSVDLEGDSKSCTVVVQKGTLKLNDCIILGDNYVRVKSIKDDRQNVLQQAFPSYAVQISGLKEIPDGGEPFFTVKNENNAKLICEIRQQIRETKYNSKEEMSGSLSKLKFRNNKEKRKFFSGKSELVQQQFNQLEENYLQKIEQYKEENNQELLEKTQKDYEEHQKFIGTMLVSKNAKDHHINLILKCSDQGTQETLLSQIRNIAFQYPDQQIQLVSASLGAVNEADIKEASHHNAIVLGMDVSASPDALKLAKEKQITIKQYRIIYGILDDIKNLIVDNQNDGKTSRKVVGSCKIQDVFDIKANKTMRKIGGIKVTNGKILRKCKFRLIRFEETIKEDLEILAMKHFKEDVSEITKGNEGGISFINFTDIQKGDILEAYEESDYIKLFKSELV